MQGRLKTENPDEIVYTVILTAPAKEWEELREQLAKRWPAHSLSNIIDDLLAQAHKIYWASPDAK